MREKVNTARLEAFIDRFGRAVESPGTVYVTGGGTALQFGFRDQTVDIDIKLDPEPRGAFDVIVRLKNELNINIELAAPDQFLPPLPDWKERSPLIRKAGKVEFRHYDPYAQVLAKIERGHELDVADARSFVAEGYVHIERLMELYESIQSDLKRYPAIDPEDLRQKVEAFVSGAA